MKRLFQFSNLVWKISLEDEGPTLILEKGLTENAGIRDWKLLENTNPKHQPACRQAGNQTMTKSQRPKFEILSG
jgi:hypothetical protein